MELQRIRARKNWVGSGEASEEKIFFDLKEKFGETITTYHSNTRIKAKILAIVENNQFLTEINSFNQDSSRNIFLVLDNTCFYATSGGQKGDDGNIIKLETQENNIKNNSKHDLKINYLQLENYLDIFETKKFAGNVFAHYISSCKGNFKVGDQVEALVNNRNRQLRSQNHSATHLLHKALKEVLGESVTQKGSQVDFKQLTFDFNLNRAMTNQEIEQVEELVNFYIRQNSIVETNEMNIDKARESGAQALFGEKYDEIVRVVKMGSSLELCGGTHVKNTGNIGIFKIISENGIASGIRRITAKSGFFALQYLKTQEQKFYALLESLKIKQQFDEVKNSDNEFLSSKIGFNDLAFFSDENTSAIISEDQRSSINKIIKQTAEIGENFIQQLKQKDKEIDKLKKQIWQENLKNLTSEKIGEINFVHYSFDNTETKDLRDIITEVKSWERFSTKQIIAFFSIKDHKVSLCLTVSNDLQLNLDASKLIIPMIEQLGGKGGGGKKDFAMGGGININGIQNAISILKQNLSN